jgi:hypothetical protein
MEFTEIELLRQRLADAEAKVEEMTTEVEQLKMDLAMFRPIGLVPSTWSEDLPAGDFRGGIATRMAYIKDGE